MYIMSLISPVAIFLTYFFNACIAHNLFITFYAYKNTYNKRIYVYKISALIGSIIIFVVSLLTNNRKFDRTEIFTVKYYPHYFMTAIYITTICIALYILFKTFYVIRKKEEFFSLMNRDDNENQETRKKVLYLLIKRHISFVLIFLLCYLPNNLIILVQIFSPYKICFNCHYYSIFIYLISLSCTFSFLLKMTEPYMRKYFKLVFNFILRKNEDITEEEKDYCSVYNENPNNLITELDLIEKEKKYNEIHDIVNSYELLNTEMACNDFFSRLIAINISISEDQKMEFDPELENSFKSFLPWTDDKYNEKSIFKEYNDKDIPDWLNINEISNIK
jgi:hypothetical protein